VHSSAENRLNTPEVELGLSDFAGRDLSFRVCPGKLRARLSIQHV